MISCFEKGKKISPTPPHACHTNSDGSMNCPPDSATKHTNAKYTNTVEYTQK